MFDSLNRTASDFQRRAFSRMLFQFQHSPVLLSLLWAFIQELQVFAESINDTINLRGPADAKGENLNAIGRIVGATRLLNKYQEIDWFSTDWDERQADVAPAWVPGAPLTYDGYANDAVFRKLIEAKVQKNFSWWGAADEIQDTASLAFDIDFYPLSFGPMEIDVIIDSSFAAWVVWYLIQQITNNTVDKLYITPIAATVRIHGVYFVPVDDGEFSFFMPDAEGHEPDHAMAAVMFLTRTIGY